jgi:8-oxo-dGTP pyrophosphatase MutT (NUDIX family)
VTPRDAASVILLAPAERPGEGALRVYLLRRHLEMAFASGMAVFPGGGVDRSDSDESVDWVGPTPDVWADRLGTSAARARTLVVAAIRELFEETGVLLATSEGAPVTGTADELEEERRRIEAHELSFTRFLADHRLALRTDLLAHWSTWVTPVFQKRRYATWFFVARLPEGQEPRNVSTEAQSSGWWTVDEALGAYGEGALQMLPPQLCQLLELRGFTTPDEAVAEVRDPEPIRPSLALDADGAYLVIPERFIALARHVAESAVTDS